MFMIQYIHVYIILADSKQQVDLNDLIGSLNNSNEYGNLKKKLVRKLSQCWC